LRIPIVVHESDTAGGLVNRIVAKMAKKIFSGFDHPGMETIGQLLSLDLLNYETSLLKQELDSRYDPSKTTILVMG
jgi:UDP-N-acetylglucosamine:LPS N-acetylglucosamine transferase